MAGATVISRSSTIAGDSSAQGATLPARCAFPVRLFRWAGVRPRGTPGLVGVEVGVVGAVPAPGCVLVMSDLPWCRVRHAAHPTSGSGGGDRVAGLGQQPPYLCGGAVQGLLWGLAAGGGRVDGLGDGVA